MEAKAERKKSFMRALIRRSARATNHCAHL
jgi:hypothetical protein